MKDLGEEHSLIIIWELIPSSAFGSSLFVQSVPSLGVTGLHFQMQNILTRRNKWFLISWTPLGLFQLNIIPRLSPSLFFFPPLEAKALLFHTGAAVSLVSPWSMLWARKSCPIDNMFVSFKDSVFSAFWATGKVFCPLLESVTAS